MHLLWQLLRLMLLQMATLRPPWRLHMLQKLPCLRASHRDKTTLLRQARGIFGRCLAGGKVRQGLKSLP